ncbi:MAG: N-6 DNA methylase [Verrucomicrobia bacterium]|nr:N-6 DNA methylase [Verrucomicrobiota bacterium]MBU4497954.1 N-6 DNA methylase [Verrucomicrobiota bacterium]MCG2680064.1 BREX-1 system adenine-specific DNA-methyltransferase PglX [Kiritimatiellia bacterium]
MNSAQARQLIKDTFSQTFDKALFRAFALNLLNHVDEDKQGSMAVPDAFATHVKSCQRLATYADPQGELLDVLIVHLTEDYKIERTRTALRDFVAHKLKRGDSYKEAALVAFVPPDAGRWRLSYVRMQYESVRDPKTCVIKPEERPTPARRFSYLVGEGESCHTAQTRFLTLLQDTATDPTLTQIEEAFSVEAVTKEFFGKYAELFGDINAALEKLVTKDKTLRDEFSAKGVNTVDFAKKLMGQIVFLYFLQKKGWLGVAKGNDWGTGPRDFLRRLAHGEYGSKYGNFFNDVLEPLFYDTLATDRGHEAWCNRFKCRIPFLNGGLFEPLGDYDWKKTDIILPNKLFTNGEFVEEGITGTGVLDVFDRYNFTVNEAEPLEKEVAIDPEMLGKVFENLIEENRRKGLGAYYTPREIVHYMCQESLINYLDTTVNKSKDIVPRAEIETFVRLGEQISHYESVDAKYAIKMPKSIQNNAKALDEALKSITVCDPAVGSGAFPVGMMTEIVRARTALTPYFKDVAERTMYHLKRHAIQNSLYGVDIDVSAVEIAKLRLWLSLVVDEENVQQIKPLPNLDYKIVAGSSLTRVEKTLFNSDQFRQLETLKPKHFDESDRQKKAEYKKQIEKLIHDLTNGLEIFDFEIYFSEVFHAKGGFDVVVANPPYISYGLRGGQKMTKEDKDYLKRAFPDSAEYKISMYAIFMELGIRISSQRNGSSCFIVPDSFLLGMYFSKIRALALKECAIRQLVLLPFKVFKADVGFSVIYLFERNSENHAANTVRSITATSSENIARRRGAEFSYSQGYFSRQRRSKFRLFFNQQTFDIVEKCRNAATPLEQLVRFSSGLIGLDGQDAISFDTKRGAKWLPGILSGGDILKFVVRPSGAYILYDKAHIKSGYDCVDYGAAKLFMRQTGDSLICSYDTTGLLCLNNVHVGNSKSTNVNLKFVCGLLNSRLLNFFYQSISLEVGRVMPQTDIETIDDLPIKCDPKSEADIAGLADDCIRHITSGRKDAAESAAKRIDRLVYDLYGLTPEEIAVVEGGGSRE